MSNILFQLLVTFGITKFEDKIKKKFVSFFFYLLFILFLVAVSFQIYINFQDSVSEININNFEKASDIESYNTNFRCKVNANNFLELLDDKNIDYQLKKVSISFIPEIENFKCFGKVETIDLENNRLVVHVVTSTTLLNIFNIFFCMVFFLSFNISSNKFSKIGLFLLYFIFDYLLNIYIFNNSLNLSFIFIKLFFLALIYSYFITSKKPSKKIELSLIFLILIISTRAFSLNLTPDDLYYLGYSVRGDTTYTSFFGNNQWFFYGNMVKILFNLTGVYSKVILEIFLSIWLTILIDKYSNYFGFNFKVKFLFPILLITNQSFAAGDQFWGSPVPKAFCYLSIFTAIYFLLKEKYMYANIFFVISVYFHLAAFIIWLPFIGFLFIKKVQFKKIIQSGLTVFIATSPLQYSLLKSNFIDLNNELLRNENLRFIIKSFMPFHVYPFQYQNGSFQGINPSWNNNFRNIFIFVLLVLIYSLFFNKDKKSFFQYIQFSTTLLLIYLIINILSPINSFILLQPYKIISLLAILSVTFILIILNQLDLKNNLLNYFGIFVLISFSILSYTNVRNGYENERIFISSTELRDEIVKINPQVILLPLYNQGTVQSNLSDIEIKTQIDTYVTYHFFPQSISSTQEWKERINNLEQFYEGDCEVFNFIDSYIFLDFNDKNECGTLIKKVNETYIYQKS